MAARDLLIGDDPPQGSAGGPVYARFPWEKEACVLQ